ncbi:Uma2 family endonuclease [Streptomyces sp. NBC_00138]|uniref:Uma2 family endonuclease n=1 Tax=Streptomyces sp. NBC_00138 TaxID=2903625 RepID=UPI00386B9D72
MPPHTQLIDGSLVFPCPQQVFHSVGGCLVERGLRDGLPDHLRVRRQMCVVIDDRNVPEPDVIVVRAGSVRGPGQTLYDAANVLLAVEVVSPESESRDRDTKPHKYAAAGIAHYWRVERADAKDRRLVVYVYELDPASRVYALTGIHRGQLKVEVPYPISVDLTEIDHL